MSDANEHHPILKAVDPASFNLMTLVVQVGDLYLKNSGVVVEILHDVTKIHVQNYIRDSARPVGLIFTRKSGPDEFPTWKAIKVRASTIPESKTSLPSIPNRKNRPTAFMQCWAAGGT